VSSGAEALAGAGAAPPLERDARPGLGRLTRVELRKMVDTRSGFWLLLAVAALMVLVVVVVQITGTDHDRTLREVLSATVQSGAVLLPVVGILLVTAEWGQRTALVTFALVPERLRVVLAKVLAAVALALVAFVLALVLAAIGVAIGAPGVDHTWTLPIAVLGQDALYAVLAMLMGLAFGAAFLSSAPAIVFYFGLPIAIGALGAISALSGTAEWVETGALAPLTQEVLSGTEWAQVLTTTLLWLALPLAIGLWRIHRNEVR
jgi:ABC-type transport system involved in multi-copper enzyme maturation permease subunit